MKRILAILLATLMVFSLAACGKETKTNDTDTTKTETIDTSKLSEVELKEIAIANATKYINDKYPEYDWEIGVVQDEITDKTYIGYMSNFALCYFGDKTFEELGMHEKTYCITFSYKTDELENENIANVYKWNSAYVVTDATKTGEAGINSCYDTYQANLIQNKMARKLEMLFYGKELAKDDIDRDWIKRTVSFTNLAYFNARYDENQDIYEFLKSTDIVKHKNNYTLVAIIEDEDVALNLTENEKEFLSLFTNVILYTDIEDTHYEYGIEGEYYKFFKGLDLKTLDKSHFSAQNFLKPVFDGIGALYEYDATNDKFVAVPFK